MHLALVRTAAIVFQHLLTLYLLDLLMHIVCEVIILSVVIHYSSHSGIFTIYVIDLS
jgi:hypothetical protein